MSSRSCNASSKLSSNSSSIFSITGCPPLISIEGFSSDSLSTCCWHPNKNIAKITNKNLLSSILTSDIISYLLDKLIPCRPHIQNNIFPFFLAVNLIEFYLILLGFHNKFSNRFLIYQSPHHKIFCPFLQIVEAPFY